LFEEKLFIKDKGQVQVQGVYLQCKPSSKSNHNITHCCDGHPKLWPNSSHGNQGGTRFVGMAPPKEGKVAKSKIQGVI
jgi:hypothetical protein